MKKLHPSVRKWVLAFLIADVTFWVWLAFGCLISRADCLEAFTFGPYLFYLPVVLLLDAVTAARGQQVTMSFPAIVALIGTLGLLSHLLLGALVGWLLRNKTIRWVIVVPVAILIVWGTGFALMRWQMREEMGRETYGILLQIDEPTASAFSYHEVSITDTPEGPSPVAVTVLDGQGWQSLENTRRTKVQVICNSAACADVAVDGIVELSWDGYVAAHAACKADPTSCPYYNIGTFDLFDMIMDPKGIIVMTQRYTP